MENYQIFISYRRDGGDALAGRLADRLKALEYKVFFDVESMRSGAFNTQILQAISQCSDFLLVLPPHALDRCSDPDDWVRLELAYALKYNKNIIPVIMRGFEFPKNLPDDIAKIRYIEGVVASSEYFDAIIARIVSLLKSSADKPADRTVKSEGFQPAIKIPKFLKTPDSGFDSWANTCIKHIDFNHEVYCTVRESVISKSLDDYLETKRSSHKSIFDNLVKDSSGYQGDRMELLGIGLFNEDKCIQEYNLYTNFESEVRKIIKKHFNGINDESLLNYYAELFIQFRDYITYLYDNQPVLFKTSIAELVWLLFEFDHPLQNAYYDSDMKMVLKHMFLLTDFDKLRETYYGDQSPISGKYNKRLNKYEILNEVSFSIQLGASTSVNANLENEHFLRMCRFLTSMLCLYVMCTSYFTDSYTNTRQYIEREKCIKKYFLINYKYLMKKGCMTKEMDQLFNNIIGMCDKHCKILGAH